MRLLLLAALGFVIASEVPATCSASFNPNVTLTTSTVGTSGSARFQAAIEMPECTTCSVFSSCDRLCWDSGPSDCGGWGCCIGTTYNCSGGARGLKATDTRAMGE
jgi:hypothetical protein